jgi:hypothetical protein
MAAVALLYYNLSRFFFSVTTTVLWTNMLNYFYLSRNELKLFIFICTHLMQLLATVITLFLIVADIMNNGFAQRIHWQLLRIGFSHFELAGSGSSCSILLSDSSSETCSASLKKVTLVWTDFATFTELFILSHTKFSSK